MCDWLICFSKGGKQQSMSTTAEFQKKRICGRQRRRLEPGLLYSILQRFVNLTHYVRNHFKPQVTQFYCIMERKVLLVNKQETAFYAKSVSIISIKLTY